MAGHETIPRTLDIRGYPSYEGVLEGVPQEGGPGGGAPGGGTTGGIPRWYTIGGQGRPPPLVQVQTAGYTKKRRWWGANHNTHAPQEEHSPGVPGTAARLCLPREDTAHQYVVLYDGVHVQVERVR